MLNPLYNRKLLVPGWAGELSDSEAVYVADQLSKKPRLRQTWQVSKFTRKRKIISLAIAKRLAIWWAQNEVSASDIQFSATVAKKTVVNIGKTSRDVRQLMFTI